MRLLFAGLGSRGDFSPMLALALRAKQEGHDAVICGPPNFAGLAARHGVEFRLTGVDVQAFLQEKARDLATRGAWHTLQHFHNAMDEHLREQFVTLNRAAEDADAIFGGGLAFAAPSIAERRKIPYCFVAYCPTVFRSAEHSPMVLPWQGLPKIVNHALWSGLGKFYNRFIGKTLNDCRRNLGLSPVTKNIIGHVAGKRLLLAADAGLAPLPRDVRLEVIRSAHEALPGQSTLDPSIEAFLDAGEKPVFIGFGSMPDDNPTKTTQAVAAVVTEVGCRVILSRGWAHLGDQLDHPRILVIDEAPHPALFSRVAAVVHHGGAGTTHTAAHSGTPQLVVVHLMDQGYWAARTHALGLSPKPLQRKNFNAQGLAEALRELLGNPGYAANAKNFAAHMAQPPPFGGLLQSLGMRIYR